MFWSIVFDFGVIALNFGDGEGGGQGARARPSLGSSAGHARHAVAPTKLVRRARLSHQFFSATGKPVAPVLVRQAKITFFLTSQIFSINVM